VRLASSATQIDEPCRFLLAAVVLVALVSGRAVSAESVSSARGIAAAPHQCKCGTRCGESCCCGPREAQSHPEAPEPIAGPDRAGVSACVLNSAPCGDRGLPSAPSDRPVSKIAALAVLEHLQLDAAGFLLPFSARCLLPSRRASRLDRPPERLIVA
jgi:hypothetical protein